MTLIKITIILFLMGLSSVTFGASKPNVIVIITDDQGYGDIGAHGNNIIKTPNIDLLHQQSVRLTDFHVAPKCAPTRAALMTGTYPRRAGVWHTVAGVSLMRPEMPSMAEIFSDSGYRTAMFGKWHLGESYPLRPHDRGFDEVFWHKGGGVGQTPDYFGNDYGQFNDNTSKDTYFRKDTPEVTEGYVTDVWFREAGDFIEQNRDRPFFVWLATNAAHTPYNVDHKYSDPYEGKEGVNSKFYGMITNIDENMGYLMKQLDKLSLSENTIVIFMTDNGSSAPNYNAGMRSIKSSIYDGGHRVPFFIRWPAGKLNHGNDVPQLTSHFDVLPTLMNLAQLTKPAKAKFDGIDFSSLLTGGSNWPDRKIIVEVQSIQIPKKYNGPSVEKNIGNVVMTSKWRWANYHELYDIKADPGQKHNVAKAHPEIMADLEQAYETWWTDVSSRNHDYVEMILGDDKENPVLLTAHDWHPDVGEITPWNQRMIKEGQAKTGWWSVNVAHAGNYKISLRRWPKEAAGPLQFGDNAKLKIGEQVYTQTFDPRTDTVVNFEVDLQKGSSKLQGWLDNDHGAYFVDVERISKVENSINKL